MEFLLTIIVITLGILFYFFKVGIFVSEQREKNVLPFKRKNFLLNIPERKFFEGLQQVIPSGYVVFPQIVLSNIVKTNSSRKEFWTYQNKINRKTIDFVVFEEQYLKPVIAIEYNGKTHGRSDRKRRDEFVNKVLESAGIKSLRIEHRKDVDFEEVKNKINESLFPVED